MQSSYQKTARDTIITGLATLITFIVGLIELPLLTKGLGAHDYGIWAQVNVTIGFVLPLTGLGLVGAMVRFLAVEKNREGIQEGFYSVLSVTMGVNLIAALIAIIFAHPLAMKFFDGAVQIVRITGILILLTPISGLYLQLIRTFRQIRKRTIFIIAQSCGQLGLIAYLILNKHGILSIVPYRSSHLRYKRLNLTKDSGRF